MGFNTVILFLGVLVGCVTAKAVIVHTPYLLNDITNINTFDNYTSLGGQFGWKLSWNIGGVGQNSGAQLGPLQVLKKNGTVLDEYMFTFTNVGPGSWSKSGEAYFTVDPCLNPLPEDEKIFTLFDLKNSNATGTVNMTVAYSSLYTIGNNANITKTTIDLSCLGVECKTFFFFNGTTDLNDYVTELNITSPIAAQLSYTYGSGHCPSVPSSEVHNVTLPANTTVTIQVANERQIWLMFDKFEDKGDYISGVAELSWKISGTSTSTMNPKLMWGLIIGGIAAAVIIIIVVVIVVVRKNRSGYTQVQ